MSGKIIAPDYHIRLFTRQRGLVTFNNVVSISVTEEVGGVGDFTLTLNYQDGVKEQTDILANPENLIHIIEPMDYIEIYMRNQVPSRPDGTPITYKDIGYSDDALGNKPVGFGIFDNKGNYRPFEYLYNYKTNSWYYEKDPGKQKPLDVIDKILNPDFVFSGFVRRISDNFSLEGGSPSTLITLSGQGVGVFLQLHQLYFGSITEDLQIKEKVANWYTRLTTIEESIKYILGDLMAKSLEQGFKLVVPQKDSNGEFVYRKVEEKEAKRLGGTQILSTKDRGPLSINIYDQEPSFNYISWSEPSKETDLAAAKAPWGRISRIQYGSGLTKNQITVKETVWEAIHKNIGAPFNEFWVDRTGNVVLRRMIDAVHQGFPSYEKQLDGRFIEIKKAGYEKVMDPVTGEEKEKYIWTDIDTNEVLSWNLHKSDDSLSTLVIGEQEVAVTGGSKIVADNIRAPISESLLEVFISTIKNQDNLKQNIITLNDTIHYLYSLQVKQFAGYSLTNTVGLKDFWKRFGIRIETFLDFASQHPIDCLIDTYLLFFYRLTSIYSGEIVIVGNPKIKAGTIIYVKRLNATFYVQSVTHTYNFGQGLQTNLKVVNGRIQDSYMDPYLEIKEVLEEARDKIGESFYNRR
jgi:hypothetical protein